MTVPPVGLFELDAGAVVAPDRVRGDERRVGRSEHPDAVVAVLRQHVAGDRDAAGAGRRPRCRRPRCRSPCCRRRSPRRVRLMPAPPFSRATHAVAAAPSTASAMPAPTLPRASRPLTVIGTATVTPVVPPLAVTPSIDGARRPERERAARARARRRPSGRDPAPRISTARVIGTVSRKMPSPTVDRDPAVAVPVGRAGRRGREAPVVGAALQRHDRVAAAAVALGARR